MIKPQNLRDLLQIGISYVMLFISKLPMDGLKKSSLKSLIEFTPGSTGLLETGLFQHLLSIHIISKHAFHFNKNISNVIWKKFFITPMICQFFPQFLRKSDLLKNTF